MADSNDSTSRIRFTENKNQWQSQILFRADVPMGYMYLEKTGFTFDLANPEDMANVYYLKDNAIKIDPEDVIVSKHAYKIIFQNANNPEVTSEGKSNDYSNYFIGNDKSKWSSKVFAYNKVKYGGLYDGIDAVIYPSEYYVKYDFIIAPGANANQIQLQYEGVNNLRIENGNLVYDISFTQQIETKPVAWQIIEGEKIYIPCNYQITNNIVSFIFPEGYNSEYTLTIDPELIFGSYTSSTTDNWGYTATYDLEGNLYGGGIAIGTGYPTTVGAYDITFAGGPGFYGCDAGITKFSSDGSSLLWSTYLGGTGNDLPHSLIVNSIGELLIYGSTGSSNFPSTTGAFDEDYNGGSAVTVTTVLEFTGVDIFIAKLSADGSSLNASTFIGGSNNDGFNVATATYYNYGDHARGEVIVDADDNVYIASSTNSDDFPVTAGSFDDDYGGTQDAIVLKMNSDLSSIIWATYLGGTSADGGYSLKLQSDGNIVVTGGTASSNFPVTDGAWDETFGGIVDAFVAILNPTGSSLIASTFAGTSQYDQSYFIETDIDDHIYITGQTRGDWEVSDDVYFNSGGSQFITKLSSDLSSVIFSTRFGSGTTAVNISPSAFLVDVCENIYVSGWGGSVNNGFNFATGTTTGMAITPDALDASTDGSDFYFIVLEKNALNLLYATFFGGPLSHEHVDGGTSRFDKSGTIYQAVCAGCGGNDDFPTTPGAWSEYNGSSNCNLGVGKIEFNLAGVYADSEADPDIVGCAPFTIHFENLSSDAEEYIWNFGDGSAESNAFEPIYTFTEAGTYTVSLVVIDSQTCNIADTAYLSVIVYQDSIHASFDTEQIFSCDSLIANFTNTSEVIDGTSYQWIFGDGSSSFGFESSHTYNTPGTYVVQLILTNPASCNYKDTAVFVITYSLEANEGFEVDASGCLPLEAVFTSNFSSADSYYWDFGNGVTATGSTVIYTFDDIGIYNVTLTIVWCGIADIETIPLVVEGFPVAMFNSDPVIGLLGANYTFINQSTGAVEYDWYFSDGGYSAEVNPMYSFGALGSFEVCLQATNASGCEDYYCRQIQIEASGAADLPTAFSPNGDGSNDILFVRGFGIKEMVLKVFNRWGELVFETTDQDQGWDGTFRGKPQENEVYVYLLQVKFDDGKSLEKQGNITLLR
ncbi:MAG: PKD domain-containing protein [Chitinophagales bacterium]